MVKNIPYRVNDRTMIMVLIDHASIIIRWVCIPSSRPSIELRTAYTASCKPNETFWLGISPSARRYMISGLGLRFGILELELVLLFSVRVKQPRP